MKRATASWKRLAANMLAAAAIAAASPAAAEPALLETLDIDRVWAGHPVPFALLTHGTQQYAAYYNAERQLTVAQRTLGSPEWTKTPLDSFVKWDSHNAVTMAMDDNGDLHLSGNMHGVPLIYFRTAQPGGARSFARIASMTGNHEDRCTYPRFFRGPKNEFLFTYRDGGSGNGVNYYNVYDHASKTWRGLLDTPLLDGEGQRNAYQRGPEPGPDGYFHMVWVWRDTGDCATNHSVSYARSKDLVHWENAAGKALPLPIRLASGATVDPVPPGGGAINGNVAYGFDAQQRIIVSYHKYDEHGHTQIYNARFEDGQWVIRPATSWDYRWDFSGGGTIGTFLVGLSGVINDNGVLTQSLRRPGESGTWRLDPVTLRAVEQVHRPATRPGNIRPLDSTFPGMQVRRAEDLGDSGEPGIIYELSWESLDANRDKPRKKPWPEPSGLRVHKIRTL